MSWDGHLSWKWFWKKLSAEFNAPNSTYVTKISMCRDPQHSRAHIYAISIFEPLHSLAFPVSKILKECLYSYLLDPKNFVSLWPADMIIPNWFRIFENQFSVFSGVNWMYRAEYDEVRSEIWLLRRRDGRKFTGVFPESGRMGRLEVADFNHVDIYFTIFWRYCGRLLWIYQLCFSNLHLF